MRIVLLLAALGVLALGCNSSSGSPVDPAKLGYHACSSYLGCGPGRYCNPQGYCWADCRSTADCALFQQDTGDETLCNLFGQCLAPGGSASCHSSKDCQSGQICLGTCSLSAASCQSNVDCPQRSSGDTCSGRCSCSDQQDCAAGHYCSGICTTTNASCRNTDECPFKDTTGETCQATCSTNCGKADDCKPYGTDLDCTPVGQCLGPGWERWIPVEALPPQRCDRDAQCVTMGWNHLCDCDKEEQARTGVLLCTGGVQSQCIDGPGLDFGDGPASSPAHTFRGTWGMRVETAVITMGFPIVNIWKNYASQLFLVKASHHQDDTLELEERICQLNMINFQDDDMPYADMAWMVIPLPYMRSMPVLRQTATVASAQTGASLDTSRLLELRGVILDNPATDPLPTLDDYQANPDDPRFFDQDQDGHPGMTTLIDGVLRIQVYNVQRWSAIYHGVILDADHVRGLAEVDSEQYMISTNNPAYLYKTSTAIHPEADRTYFRLMRLADDASCDDLIREASQADSWLRHTNHMMDVADP